MRRFLYVCGGIIVLSAIISLAQSGVLTPHPAGPGTSSNASFDIFSDDIGRSNYSTIVASVDNPPRYAVKLSDLTVRGDTYKKINSWDDSGYMLFMTVDIASLKSSYQFQISYDETGKLIQALPACADNQAKGYSCTPDQLQQGLGYE